MLFYLPSLTDLYIILTDLNNRMTNIKITIRDVDSGPLLIQKNQMSETEHRKKNSLYQQPQRDKGVQKKQRSANNTNKNSRDDKGLRQTGLRSSGEQQVYRQAEKKMMEDMDKMGKNQASLDMIHNSNNILKKQNQILEDNQRTLYQMAKNNNPKPEQSQQSKQLENVLIQIKKEVNEMKKIKEEIERSSKEFMKSAGDVNKGNSQQPGVPSKITEMNSNLKHLAEASKGQLEGLEDLEAIKHLQNFNIEGYQQAINNLKRQIVQYQKESQQIERQLKLRAAKLQKLQISPNFDEKLLEPYENYLKRKAQNVDLHAIKDKIYDKLGYFDYGKFQYDTNQLMAGVKGQINDFYIVCRQYKIQVPDIKIDQKELRGLDLKLPSAIDQFKAERGIDFSKPAEKSKTDSLADSRAKRDKRKGEPVVSLKYGGPKMPKSRQPQGIRELNSKPIDMSTQVRYNKTNQPNQKTVLQNMKQKERKEVQSNMRKMKKPKEDEDFEKYLEYRAREELELIYKEKKERLQKKQNELLDFCKEDEGDVYLNLDLRNDVRREVSREKKKEESPKRQQQKKEVIKEEEEQIPKLKPIPGTGGQTIKEVGTQVLKQKLKNLLGGNNLQRRPQHEIPQPIQPSMPQVQQPDIKMEGVAENFLSLINNTLTQVNGQLSKSIQSRYENRSLSRERSQTYRRSPSKIQIPKLEQFRPPPQFSMPAYNPTQQQTYHHPVPTPVQVPVYVEKPRTEQAKIVPKNYDHLRIKEDEAMEDLEISQDSYAADFE